MGKNADQRFAWNQNDILADAKATAVNPVKELLSTIFVGGPGTAESLIALFGCLIYLSFFRTVEILFTEL